MVFRNLSMVLLAGCFIAVGCGKRQVEIASDPAAPLTNRISTAEAPAVVLETVARVHWQGTERLQADTNATDLRAILQLPESKKLKTQTLNKLAQALSNRTSDMALSSILRPLLDDLLLAESYFEVRQGTNVMPYVILALRLNENQAAVWNTNIISLLKIWVHAKPSAGKPGAWVLKIPDHGPALFESKRANGWTILSLSPEPSAFFEAVVAKFEADSVSPVIWTSNYWFEVEANLERLPALIRTRLPDHLPRVGISIVGDKKDLRIDGEFNFSAPLQLDLEPWKVPADLIDAGLSSFTAVRGLQRWLDTFPPWQKLNLGPAPNEAFCWGLRGLQMQTYFAVPIAGASNVVAKLAERAVESDPWGGTNDLAGFQKAQGSDGFEWKGLPYLWPFVHSVKTNETEVVFGGTFPAGTVYPVTPEVLHVLNPTNLFYYDWEASSARTEQWLYMMQFARLVFHKAQLTGGASGTAWLQAVSPKLGNSITQGTLTGPAQLSIVRKSSIGLTGIELQLLVDWLESPDFPFGLHTFRAEPEKYP